MRKPIIILIGIALFFGCSPEVQTEPCEINQTFEITFTNDADYLIGVAVGFAERDTVPESIFTLEPGGSTIFTFETGELLVVAAADSLWEYSVTTVNGIPMHWETTEFYPCENVDYHINDTLKNSHE